MSDVITDTLLLKLCGRVLRKRADRKVVIREAEKGYVVTGCWVDKKFVIEVSKL